MLKPLVAAAIGFLTLISSAQAQGWELDATISEVSFGSIKSDFVGEVHRFDNLSGSVGPNGNVEILIDLTSVNTNIDLRNSRMVEYIFKDYTTAEIRTEIDVDLLAQMPVGGVEIFSIFGTLEFLDKAHDLQMDITIARLSETRVMASTRNMIFLNAEDLGITSSLAQLANLANLPGITGAVPVTFQFIFDAQGAAPAAPQLASSGAVISAQGDAQRGIKVYMRCFSCHSVKEGRHGTGPSLHNVIGRPAGTQADYQYSEALAGAGFPWTEEELLNFLTNPGAYIPGTSMAFEGLYDQADIADLLSYLAAQQ